MDAHDDPISALNASFWDELCGTHQAIQLGVTDSSPESLKRFDDWYFSFYPYLKRHLDRAVQTRGRVLEIGLGYGSVAGFLMAHGADYFGLDIATGPVSMANLRAHHLGLTGSHAKVGNALDMPQFRDSTFNAVIAIGSLHHTGNFRLSMQEVARVTAPGGTIIGMVYSAFSLRNWKRRPREMFGALLSNHKNTGVVIQADEQLRWFADHNQAGTAAPATEYFSRRALRTILSEYGRARIRCRNFDVVKIPFAGGVGGNFLRRILLATPLPWLLGLDLYFEVTRS